MIGTPGQPACHSVHAFLPSAALPGSCTRQGGVGDKPYAEREHGANERNVSDTRDDQRKTAQARTTFGVSVAGMECYSWNRSGDYGSMTMCLLCLLFRASQLRTHQYAIRTEQGAWRAILPAVLPMNRPHIRECPLCPSTRRSARSRSAMLTTNWAACPTSMMPWVLVAPCSPAKASARR